MYEINLVPEVKAQLLRKQKLKKLIWLASIGVMAGCAAIIVVLVTFLTGQAVTLGAKENEIVCRRDGRNDKGSCDVKKYGVSALNYNNQEALLTIQSEMQNLDNLNHAKVRLTRIFGLLDILLITGEKSVEMQKLSVDVENGSLTFDAIGRDKKEQGFTVAQTFKENAKFMYYDYGDYVMINKNGTGGEEVIPSYCVSDETIGGVPYGIFHSGIPGCGDAPMVEREATEKEKKEGDEEPTVTPSDETPPSGETPPAQATKYERVDYYIRRYYASMEDMEQAKQGKIFPELVEELGGKPERNGVQAKVAPAYFKSNCLVFKEDGSFDEETSLANCPVLENGESDIQLTNASYGIDKEGNKAESFRVFVAVSSEIFKGDNHYVMVIGPSRRNVTDSYTQVRDMFTTNRVEKAGDGEN